MIHLSEKFPGVPLNQNEGRGPGSAARALNNYSLLPPLNETNFSEQYKKYNQMQQSP